MENFWNEKCLTVDPLALPGIGSSILLKIAENNSFFFSFLIKKTGWQQFHFVKIANWVWKI